MNETEAVDCSAFDADKSEAFDAEAALVALGTRFEWLRQDGVHLGVVTLPDGALKQYVVIDQGRVAFLASSLGKPSVSYTTLTTAKAACERHRATGKWE